jgi:hypothetical protein
MARRSRSAASASKFSAVDSAFITNSWLGRKAAQLTSWSKPVHFQMITIPLFVPIIAKRRLQMIKEFDNYIHLNQASMLIYGARPSSPAEWTPNALNSEMRLLWKAPRNAALAEAQNDIRTSNYSSSEARAPGHIRNKTVTAATQTPAIRNHGGAKASRRPHREDRPIDRGPSSCRPMPLSDTDNCQPAPSTSYLTTISPS